MLDLECVKACVWLRMQENVSQCSHLLVVFLNCRGRGKGEQIRKILKIWPLPNRNEIDGYIMSLIPNILNF